MKSIIIIILSLLLTACSSTNDHLQNISGLWSDEQGKFYYLDNDGTLGLPDQVLLSGVHWSIKDRTLILSTLDNPTSTVQEHRLTLKKSSYQSLEFTDSRNNTIIWTRSLLPVKKLEGTLLYRERIALPPQITLHVQMYSQSTLQPSALTIAHVSGQAPLQFKLYYLKRSTEQHMLLTASLFNGSERLFATQRAISIDTDTHPEILLYRTESRNDILPSLQPPRQYQGQIKNNNNFYQISLYLEEKGGALLLQNDQQHIGSWIEKDKNHSLEITCEGDSPITATRATNGPLLLKGLFSLPIELSLAKLSWPSGHIVMEGKIFKKKKQIIFEECNSQRELSLVLKNSQLAQINKLIQEKNTISVIIEGTFQENDFHPTYIFSVNDNPICLTASYASSPLLHTYWRLREVQGTVIQSFTDQPEPHLILNENGQASGSDGCNNFFMGWKQSGKNITFTPGGSTLRLCTQGEEQAQQILSIFSKIDSWNILGSILEFRGKENITAVFEAIDL